MKKNIRLIVFSSAIICSSALITGCANDKNEENEPRVAIDETSHPDSVPVPPPGPPGIDPALHHPERQPVTPRTVGPDPEPQPVKPIIVGPDPALIATSPGGPPVPIPQLLVPAPHHQEEPQPVTPRTVVPDPEPQPGSPKTTGADPAPRQQRPESPRNARSAAHQPESPQDPIVEIEPRPEPELPIRKRPTMSSIGTGLELTEIAVDPEPVTLPVPSAQLQAELELVPPPPPESPRSAEPDSAQQLSKSEDIDDGSTPLHLAVWTWEGDNSKIERLIKANADVNAKDDEGRTALHVAASKGSHIAVVDMLIQAQSDVNAQDIGGDTVLHDAVTSHNLDIVKLLIRNGARIDIKNSKGQTVLDFAREYQEHFDIEDIVEFLELEEKLRKDL